MTTLSVSDYTQKWAIYNIFQGHHLSFVKGLGALRSSSVHHYFKPIQTLIVSWSVRSCYFHCASTITFISKFHWSASLPVISPSVTPQPRPHPQIKHAMVQQMNNLILYEMVTGGHSVSVYRHHTMATQRALPTYPYLPIY